MGKETGPPMSTEVAGLSSPGASAADVVATGLAS